MWRTEWAGLPLCTHEHVPAVKRDERYFHDNDIDEAGEDLLRVGTNPIDAQQLSLLLRSGRSNIRFRSRSHQQRKSILTNYQSQQA